MLDHQDATRRRASMNGRVQLPHPSQHRFVGGATEVLDFRGQAGRLSGVSLGATIVWVMAAQQLTVVPYPGTTGQPVVVSVQRDDTPVAGVEFEVASPGGATRSCGATGSDGRLRFVPEVAGEHVFVCSIDGVRHVMPLAVRGHVDKWPLAVASVPLGLALLWWNLSRARGRRAP